MEILIEAKVDSIVQVTVHIEDVIIELNKMPIERRWSSIASMIIGVEADLNGISEKQKATVKKFLLDKLLLFE